MFTQVQALSWFSGTDCYNKVTGIKFPFPAFLKTKKTSDCFFSNIFFPFRMLRFYTDSAWFTSITMHFIGKFSFFLFYHSISAMLGRMDRLMIDFQFAIYKVFCVDFKQKLGLTFCIKWWNQIQRAE